MKLSYGEFRKRLNKMNTLEKELHLRFKDVSNNDLFLNWICEQGIQIKEHHFQLGKLKYFCFQAADESKNVHGFGMDLDRKTAILKSCGELIERQQMIKYFTQDINTPNYLKNSNGWAAHTDLSKAKENAENELLERHLLQKSFLKHGWDGFNLVDQIKIDDLTLFINTSKYKIHGKTGLLVAVSSKKFKGVSFGYGLSNRSQLGNLNSWYSAIFEAVTRVYNYDSQLYESVKDNYIQNRIYRFLTTPFDFSVFKKSTANQDFNINEEILPKIKYKIFDLKDYCKLQFPFYAVYASSEDLIPLITGKHYNFSYLKYLLGKHEIHTYQETPIL